MTIPLLLLASIAQAFVAGPSKTTTKPHTTKMVTAAADDLSAILAPFREETLWDRVRLGVPASVSHAQQVASEQVPDLVKVSFEGNLMPLGLAVATAGAMVAAGLWLVGDLEARNEDAVESPYPEDRYDRFAAARFFDRRPLQSLRRAAQIAVPLSKFGLKVLTDGAERNEKARRAEQAEVLVETLAGLGPTFIKVGQALSIRSDLLSPEYCDALATLQDKCPPFDTWVAKSLIVGELGLRKLEDVFVDFPAEPIASASLGQVYKTAVRAEVFRPFPPPNDDDDGIAFPFAVAVKVQRPDVVETIALDLHLLRVTTPVVKALFRLNTDLPGIVDAWGERFVDELDYGKEADNAARFSQSIAATPLAGVVFAPAAIAPCSSRRVLTTEWVQGKRLDADDNHDRKISALCSVAMNAYLTMMLETGLLHADPHPGNLLVEDDTNRLAILDWGLVTSLDAGLRVAYIEHIAHLVAKDYASVPADLVALGFVPAGYEDAIESSDAVEVLSNVYTQFAAGGGANKIDVPAVLDSLRGLADRQGNLFQLPPYFAYIARAFSVLEGIGLRNDPDFAIVGECLPYISQRLVSDPSPRVAKALETFIYGSRDEARVDAKRVEYLLDGLGSFAQSATPDDDPGGAVQTARRVADLLLRDGPSPTQIIVERELAKLAGATARSAASQIRDLPVSLAIANFLDPFRLLEPLARGPLVQPDRDDHLALAAFARIRRKASPQLADAVDDLSNLSPEAQGRALREIFHILWEYRAGALDSARRFSQQLAAQTADRLLKRPDDAAAAAADPTNTNPR
ncbi:hypothetical protein CTAYLR_009565 [Chrysophaeum taylorii]|uniref:ABC1 atypical kinase-like domain-containing protein n=1 Tax=Chrysophaeum taylorii TaxID=2483200 RepID=A0AAD7UHI8_9STRA|nr:hypothetical protein CTAYLR_009565 [Chrysophaeum taylorii]